MPAFLEDRLHVEALEHVVEVTTALWSNGPNWVTGRFGRLIEQPYMSLL